jgi:hypothetical protein
MSNRVKDVRGSYKEWAKKNLVMEDEELADSMPAQEAAAGAYLAARLAATEAPSDMHKE